MPMGLCNQCYEKNWRFKKVDGYVIATCNLCEYEVEFVPKRKRKTDKPSYNVNTEGQECPKCKTPVIRRIPTWKRERLLKQTYVYDYYLYCTGCKTMYMVESARRLVSELSPLDIMLHLKN